MVVYDKKPSYQHETKSHLFGGYTIVLNDVGNVYHINVRSRGQLVDKSRDWTERVDKR